MKWVRVAETLPEKYQYVLLVADRYWNTPEGMPSMKVTATGYLAELGHLHWSIFGERAMTLESFTHWCAIEDVPD